MSDTPESTQQQPGRNFKLTRLGKNRFEFRSAYTHVFGTASEMLAILAQQLGDARRNVVELAAWKHYVIECAIEDAVDIQDAVVPKAAEVAAPVVVPEEAPKKAPKKRATGQPPAPKEEAAHDVTVVELGAVQLPESLPANDNDKPAAPAASTSRRRPNGLAHLAALRAQLALDKSG